MAAATAKCLEITLAQNSNISLFTFGLKKRN